MKSNIVGTPSASEQEINKDFQYAVQQHVTFAKTWYGCACWCLFAFFSGMAANNRTDKKVSRSDVLTKTKAVLS